MAIEVSAGLACSARSSGQIASTERSPPIRRPAARNASSSGPRADALCTTTPSSRGRCPSSPATVAWMAPGGGSQGQVGGRSPCARAARGGQMLGGGFSGGLEVQVNAGQAGGLGGKTDQHGGQPQGAEHRQPLV